MWARRSRKGAKRVIGVRGVVAMASRIVLTAAGRRGPRGRGAGRGGGGSQQGSRRFGAGVRLREGDTRSGHAVRGMREERRRPDRECPPNWVRGPALERQASAARPAESAAGPPPGPPRHAGPASRAAGPSRTQASRCKNNRLRATPAAKPSLQRRGHRGSTEEGIRSWRGAPSRPRSRRPPGVRGAPQRWPRGPSGARVWCGSLPVDKTASR